MSGTFRSRLLSGEQLIGAMVTLPTPATAEILAEAGFDWLFIDGEHSPLESPDIAGILQSVGHRIACVVRVPNGDEVPIKKVLDLGADGIIVPQVNTASQAADVVRHARYAPLGQRGVGLARAHGYGARFQQYLDTANDSVAVIVQAEHTTAVENIDEIVRVAGVDAIQLGPYDLSASMGKMGMINDPEVTGAIDRITRACQQVGMSMGYFGVTADAVKPYMDQGYSLITVGVDTLMLATAAKNIVAQFH